MDGKLWPYPWESQVILFLSGESRGGYPCGVKIWTCTQNDLFFAWVYNTYTLYIYIQTNITSQPVPWQSQRYHDQSLRILSYISSISGCRLRTSDGVPHLGAAKHPPLRGWNPQENGELQGTFETHFLVRKKKTRLPIEYLKPLKKKGMDWRKICISGDRSDPLCLQVSWFFRQNLVGLPASHHQDSKMIKVGYTPEN